LLLQRAEEAKQKEKTTPSGNRLHKASDIPFLVLIIPLAEKIAHFN
jgi:hypothetical protein